MARGYYQRMTLSRSRHALASGRLAEQDDERQNGIVVALLRYTLSPAVWYGGLVNVTATTLIYLTSAYATVNQCHVNTIRSLVSVHRHWLSLLLAIMNYYVAKSGDEMTFMRHQFTTPFVGEEYEHCLLRIGYYNGGYHCYGDNDGIVTVTTAICRWSLLSSGIDVGWRACQFNMPSPYYVHWRRQMGRRIRQQRRR